MRCWQAVGKDDIVTASLFPRYEPMKDMVVQWVSEGDPVLILFNAPVRCDKAAGGIDCRLEINGVEAPPAGIRVDEKPYNHTVCLHWLHRPTSGIQMVRVVWTVGSPGARGFQDGAYPGHVRVLTVIEL